MQRWKRMMGGVLAVLIGAALGCAGGRGGMASEPAARAASPQPEAPGAGGAGRIAPVTPHTHLHPHRHGAGPAGHDHEHAATCTCDEARRVNGWCEACAVGYLAGLPIRSEDLFEALDPHGHEINPATIDCAACHTAMRVDGWCGRCGFGFVSGQLYASKPAHALARGTRTAPGSIGCAVCRRHAAGFGWCGSCGTGMVSDVRFTDRAAFEDASREYARVRLAIETVPRCEGCAIVMITGGPCPYCAGMVKPPR